MATDRAWDQRHLPIEGTYNFRDVGSYRTADGRAVRWRTLFRSDSLHRLTPAGKREVLALGVRSIIDLRSAGEIVDWPNPFASNGEPQYYHLPLISQDFIEGPPPDTLEELYRLWIDECQQNIAVILRTIARPDSLPLLVHCARGKDRAGLVVALLLKLAGVPRSTVVEDYTLTANYSQQVPDKMAYAQMRGLDTERYSRLMECRPEAMESALDYLDQRYGGAAGYARTIGVGQDAIDALDAALTEDRR